MEFDIVFAVQPAKIILLLFHWTPGTWKENMCDLDFGNEVYDHCFTAWTVTNSWEWGIWSLFHSLSSYMFLWMRYSIIISQLEQLKILGNGVYDQSEFGHIFISMPQLLTLDLGVKLTSIQNLKCHSQQLFYWQLTLTVNREKNVGVRKVLEEVNPLICMVTFMGIVWPWLLW